MRRAPLFWIAWSAFAVAWIVPVHKDGITLPEGVPGWQAFRIAAAPVWPYEGVEHESWWGATLSTLSAATNFVMLGSLWTRQRGQLLRRATAIAAFAAFIVNAQWVFLNTDWVDLRPGYYLWWTSFLVMSLIAAPGVVASLKGQPSQDAAA